MNTTTTPSTQPVMRSAYTGVNKRNGDNRIVVYGGYEGGHHLVIVDNTTYRAQRTSPENKEPEFEYDPDDVVR